MYLLHWRVLDLVFQSDFLLDDVDEVDDDDEDADDVLTGLLVLGSTTSSSSWSIFLRFKLFVDEDEAFESLVWFEFIIVVSLFTATFGSSSFKLGVIIRQTRTKQSDTTEEEKKLTLEKKIRKTKQNQSVVFLQKY